MDYDDPAIPIKATPADRLACFVDGHVRSEGSAQCARCGKRVDERRASAREKE